MSQEDGLLVPECHLVGRKLFTQVGGTSNSPSHEMYQQNKLDKLHHQNVLLSFRFDHPSFTAAGPLTSLFSSFVILLDITVGNVSVKSTFQIKLNFALSPLGPQ